MKIKAGNLALRHTLELKPQGVEYVETALIGGRRFFRFDQVDAILRGPNLLSFQAGNEIFTIPIDPNNPEHSTFAAKFASEAKRTVRRS